MTNAKSQLPRASLIGEAYFAKVTDYIDPLSELRIGPLPGLALKFVKRNSDAENLAQVAKACKQVEDMQLEVPAALLIFAIGDDPAVQHPLNWLNISECKRTDESRSCHEWYVCLEDGVLTLTFEHEKFGYRRETCPTWSAAFARLSELMAGHCSWQEFGDVESRNTLLGKGQFYWSAPDTGEHIPVDNFVFMDADQREVTLAGVSHRCALSLCAGEHDASEWYDDYAGALLRAADILEEGVLLENFGQGPGPETYEQAGGRTAPPPGISTWLSRGQFVVKSIYGYQDVLPAPVLVYKTYEGIQAELNTTLTEWSLRVSNIDQQWKTVKFSERESGDALRTLARVLKGSLLWADLKTCA